MITTNNTAALPEVADFALSINSALAAEHGEDCHLIVVHRNAIEVRINPERLLNPDRRPDFVRVTIDDATVRVSQLTYNRVICGEATLSGSLAAFAPALVAEHFDTV